MTIFESERKALEPLMAYARNCRVAVEPTGEMDMVRLTVSWDGGSAGFVIDDEYEDVRPSNVALSLGLLRLNIEEMREAPDAEEWARMLLWDVPPARAEDTLKANLDNYARLEGALGDIPDIIRAFDVELGSGVVAALRQMG